MDGLLALSKRKIIHTFLPQILEADRDATGGNATEITMVYLVRHEYLGITEITKTSKG